jgi:hypothetical protein
MIQTPNFMHGGAPPRMTSYRNLDLSFPRHIPTLPVSSPLSMLHRPYTAKPSTPYPVSSFIARMFFGKIVCE